MTAALSLYRRFMGWLHGFVPRILAGRVRDGKEDPERFGERLGAASIPRPDGRLVWLHGVSIGESLSALPVIERLREKRPDLQVLITTATPASAEILARRLPRGVIHQFAPVDTPQAVTAFLDHWRPDTAVFIESDIWPVLLMDLTARQVPHALLSARITPHTHRGWQGFRASMKSLLAGYALIMPQDPASEERLRQMGVETAAVANLKLPGDAPAFDGEALAALKAMADGRRIVVAASTHYGEDTLIARAIEAWIRSGDLLVVVPRHPVKAADIRLDIEAIGLHVAQRSLKEPVTYATQVYLADTLGELGLFFALSDVVIMGGSFLTRIGGHNPLEAARLGKGVITGGDTANWEGIYGELIEAGAAWQVFGPQELSFLYDRLHDAPEAVAAAGRAALAVSRRQADIVGRVWAALEPLLPRPEAANDR